MKLTITVDPEVLERARVRAVEEGTSVSTVLREQLAAYADRCRTVPRAAEDAARERAEAIRQIIRLSKAPRPVAAPLRPTRDAQGNRNWKRDDLYDR